MVIQLETEKSQFKDLVKNIQLFNDKYSEEDLLTLPRWKDHAHNGYYNNYPHIDELLSQNLTDEDLEKSYVVRIPISYIFSSEESLGGCDRPIWTSNLGDKQCRINLDSPNGSGQKKGFRPEDALVLAAYLRPCGKGKYQVVKYIGNNRVWMKLLVTKGVDSEVLVSIRFHKEGSLEDYIAREAESHSADAGDRSGQNEHQKFVSSYRAGRKNAVHCFNYLRRHKLEYKNIMLLEGVRPDTKITPKSPWLGINSLQGIKDGVGNGFFHKYEEISVDAAIEIVKEVKTITNESCVASTPIECFAQLHYIFTNFGIKDNGTPLFLGSELKKFFIKFFEVKNQQIDPMFGAKDGFKLSDLTVSGGVKDVAYINAMTFWPYIVEYHKSLNDKKYGFSFDSKAIDKFLGCCKDPLLLNQIKAKLAS